jgi:hypothetical protein
MFTDAIDKKPMQLLMEKKKYQPNFLDQEFNSRTHVPVATAMTSTSKLQKNTLLPSLRAIP